jgi:hypothetical protein
MPCVGPDASKPASAPGLCCLCQADSVLAQPCMRYERGPACHFYPQVMLAAASSGPSCRLSRCKGATPCLCLAGWTTPARIVVCVLPLVCYIRPPSSHTIGFLLFDCCSMSRQLLLVFCYLGLPRAGSAAQLFSQQ